MNTPTPKTPPRVVRLARRFVALPWPRSVAAKLYTITALALAVIVVLGGMTVILLNKLATSSQQIAILYEVSQRTEDLFRGTLRLSQELNEVGKAGNTHRIPVILAQNESLVSDLAAYRSLAEAHNLADDAAFIFENESLIMQIREDVYQALNLHRTGASDRAAVLQARIDRNVLHLATAIERSAAQRRLALADELKNLAALQQQQIWLMVALFAGSALLLFGASFRYARSIATSLKQLAAATNEIAAGNYAHRIATQSGDEIARVAMSFNTMSGIIEEREGTLRNLSASLEERNLQLSEQAAEQARLQEAIIRMQATALAELSTPLIPITDQILVMPLIGALDTSRTQQILETLLRGVEASRAQVAIIDVTGVPVVDTQVAKALIHATQAVRLLGAQVALTGIRPEVAQALVGLGVDLQEVITQSTLQTGIAFMQRRLQHAAN
jgi:anti-anti-sigma regulatory factor/HAMP domain-containing protein